MSKYLRNLIFGVASSLIALTSNAESICVESDPNFVCVPLFIKDRDGETNLSNKLVLLYVGEQPSEYSINTLPEAVIFIKGDDFETEKTSMGDGNPCIKQVVTFSLLQSYDPATKIIEKDADRHLVILEQICLFAPPEQNNFGEMQKMHKAKLNHSEGTGTLAPAETSEDVILGAPQYGVAGTRGAWAFKEGEITHMTNTDPPPEGAELIINRLPKGLNVVFQVDTQGKAVTAPLKPSSSETGDQNRRAQRHAKND